MTDHTASIPPSSLPPCPKCGYDLRATIDANENRCPECGWEFTMQDLALLGPSNMRGEPRSLKPAESRWHGPILLALLAAISITFVVLAVILPRL